VTKGFAKSIGCKEEGGHRGGRGSTGGDLNMAKKRANHSEREHQHALGVWDFTVNWEKVIRRRTRGKSNSK